MATVHINAATHMETVYSPEGEEVVVSRLNAIDLIRTNGFSWKKPAELVAAIVEIAKETATDVADVVKEVAEDIKDAAEKAADAVKEVFEDAKDAAEEVKESVENLSLKDAAILLTGSADIAAYLSGFTIEMLRELAETRFGEKVHHRMSKESVISKLVSLEAEKSE